MPKFRKTQKELSTHLDYWLYYLNNLANTTEIPTILKEDKVLEEAFEVAEFLALDKDAQFSYQQDLKARWDNQACLDFAEEKGLEKGAKNREIEIAKSLLLAQVAIKIITETTGLSIQEIEKLK
jgi:predicted transposase/invertase (TIGR01784 family)